MKKNLYFKISKFSFSLFTLLILFLPFPVYSEVFYPEYTGENVVDISGKFDNRYVSNLQSELRQSANEVRIVFLNTKDKINLDFYAPKLFHKWNMTEYSILVVIDPYLDKTGYGIGTKVLEEMRKRQSLKTDAKDKQVDKKIDYDNLASAIFDKFSPAQIKKEEQKLVNKNQKKNSSPSERGFNSPSSSSSNKSLLEGYSLKKILPIITIIAFIVSILGSIGYFYFNNKRLKEQLELQTNYTFDADILKDEIMELIEKINLDIKKMSQYKGGTQKEVKLNLEKLNTWKNKGELFIDKLNSELEDTDIDNLVALRELLDEGSIIKDNLIQTHKESVDIRKDFKSTIKKTSMNISDIRVNLENCKVSLESIRTIYKLPLVISEKKINDCENSIEEINILASENNPTEVRELSQEIYNKIKNIKKELDIIPHLYRQLQETIPISIDSSIEESILDSHQRNKNKREINNLKNDALISLSNGDLDHSELLIKDIFDKLNKIRLTADKM